MRVTLEIDSATEAELRAVLLAYHQSKEDFEAPPLHPDGMVVKVEGPRAYGIASPPINAARAQRILDAAQGEGA